MLRLFVAAVLGFYFLSTCEALTCMRCEGTPDSCEGNLNVDSCEQFGSNQVCNNFFYWSNGKPLVQKGCYQSTACQVQEKRPDNDCGEFAGNNRPCRCCCKTNRCNRLKKGCIVPSKCGKPKNPRIGSYACPVRTRLGSVCNFTCPGEYDQVGPKRTVCVRSGATGKLVWNPLGQACRKIRCKKIFAPENGEMECVNKGRYENQEGDNFLGTTCSFTCNKGYKRRGAKKTVCKSDQTWTNDVPTCVRDPCDPIEESPNRIDTCTNGFMLDSVCSFRCKKGYKLVGSERAKCVEQNGKKVWDREPPTCIQVKCLPKQKNPVDGSVSCTNENFENSVCTFKCDEGYDIDGTDESTTTITCRDDEDGDVLGEWTGPPATCTRMECLPRITKINNGVVTCTDENNVGSVCTFVCDKGYDLEGSAKKTLKSSCNDDKDGDNLGEWSRYPPPTCTRIRCIPPHRNPVNGRVTCSDANNEGSICKFRCNKGYDLDGTTLEIVESECEDDGDGDDLGEWSKKAPTCTVIECEVLVGPENGSMKCTNENVIGSTCEFECDYGYARIGESEVTCEDAKADQNNIGEWSGKVPRCSELSCLSQKHDSTVVRSCDPSGVDSFSVGTRCTYTCAEDGHYLVSHETPTVVEKSGSLVTTCQETTKWDREAPKCIPVRCPTITRPENSHRPSCSNANWLGSVCGFACLPTYALSHTEPLVCESDGTDADKIGKWSREPPTCEKAECDSFGQVNNGKITYTNGLNIGTWANLTCNGGYTYKFHEASQCLPKDDSHPLPYWSKIDNVCCVICIFNPRIRVVTVVDKTAAQNQREWEEIVTWHYYLLEHLFKNYDVRFGMVLYDDEVDTANTMREQKVSTLEDVEDIQWAMYDFPYGGTGSNTAVALDYAKRTYFRRYTATTTSRRPKEEPFLIVIKRTGPPGDAVSSAELLRNDRIHLIAFGYKKGNFRGEAANLALLTGDLERVTMIGSVPDVTKAGEGMTEISKAQGCSASSRSAKCT